jgi:hypothetical protein
MTVSAIALEILWMIQQGDQNLNILVVAEGIGLLESVSELVELWFGR